MTRTEKLMYLAEKLETWLEELDEVNEGGVTEKIYKSVRNNLEEIDDLVEDMERKEDLV